MAKAFKIGEPGIIALNNSDSSAPGIKTTTVPNANPFKIFIANLFAVILLSISFTFLTILLMFTTFDDELIYTITGRSRFNDF